MTNEELKKKIVEIIINAIWKDAEAEYDSTDETEAGSIADALIAAGIGDVKEAETEANRYEMLYSLQSRDMALAERKAYESEHRAAKAEKALKHAVNSCIAHWETSSKKRWWYKYFLREAEKELAEEGKNG